MNRPKTIHKMTSPSGEVFILQSDKELSRFDIVMWEIKELLALARSRMKEPIFYIKLASPKAQHA